MNIDCSELGLEGAYELQSKKKLDHRGWFVRLFCQNELFAINKGKNIMQINSSWMEISCRLTTQYTTRYTEWLHYQMFYPT